MPARPAKVAAVGMALAPADIAEVQRNVVGAPWAAPRNLPSACPVIYIITANNCPYCHAFIRESMVSMDDAGFNMRFILAPVMGVSLDVAAEVAMHRDFTTMMRAQMNLPISAPDAQAARDGRITAFNGLVHATETVRNLAHRAGYSGYTPGFVWQDRADQWRMYPGYTAASMAGIRASMPQPGPECRPH